MGVPLQEDRAPWAPESIHPHHVFYKAQILISQRNLSSIDAFIDPLKIVPVDTASTYRAVLSEGMETPRSYTIQSPCQTSETTLLWITTENKLMVSSDHGEMRFALFLRHASENSFTRTFNEWRKLPEEQIKNFPQGLRKEATKRWKAINLFPFKRLPKELGDKIINFALASPAIIEPKQRKDRSLGAGALSRIVDLSLVSRNFCDQTHFLIYSQTTLRFSNLERYEMFINMLSDARRKMVRSIDISFNYLEMLHFFRCGVALTPYTQDIEALESLQHLRIDVSTLPWPPNLPFTRRTLYLLVWGAARRYIRRIPDMRFQLGKDGADERSLNRAWDLEKVYLREGMKYDAEDLEQIIVAKEVVRSPNLGWKNE